MLATQQSEDRIKYVFIDKLFYVQAITSGRGTVQYYAVTIRDRRFKVDVPLPNGGRYTFNDPPVKIRLGLSTFGSVPWKPESVIASLGARRAWYGEDYYLGNPMNCQRLMLIWNDAGFGPWPPLKQLLSDFGYTVTSERRMSFSVHKRRLRFVRTCCSTATGSRLRISKFLMFGNA